MIHDQEAIFFIKAPEKSQHFFPMANWEAIVYL